MVFLLIGGLLVKKILYIHHGRGIGGAPLSLLYLIRKLNKKKYLPVVACTYYSEAVEMFKKDGIETYSFSGIRNFPHSNVSWYRWYQFHRIFLLFINIWIIAFKVAPEFFKKISPDLIHLNSPSLLGWAIAAKKRKIPVICHVREPMQKGYFGVRKFFLKHMIHFYVDKFVAICKYDASKLVQSDKIHVIYNFVDFSYFDRNIKCNSKIKNKTGDMKIVLYLGGMSKIKGALELLQASLYFLEDDTHLLIAGKWEGNNVGGKSRVKEVIKQLLHISIHEELKRVWDKIKENKLESQIHFLGIVSDIPSLIACCDLLVFPSTVPHFARPIIEAGAMAKPVVASNLGGPKELVIDGKTGLLVPPGKPEALAKAIRRILNNKQLAQQMGEVGYQRAFILFNADKNAEETFELYEDLINV